MSSVEETFFRLSEVVLQTLEPFARRSGGGGFHTPSEELLLQLYAKSSVGLHAVKKRDPRPVPACVLQ
jgi:hypothetical protein